MKSKLIAGIIIGVVFLSLLFAAIFKGTNIDYYGNKNTGNAVGVIRISGVIVGGVDSSSLFSTVSGSETVMAQLRMAAEDPAIKVVVLRLNTPGGTTAASQEIALEIDRLRQQGKKVVASMGDTAASGGYWIASRCDKIVANPGTITGSIGVILETQDMQELFEKIGVDPRVFKSGEHKDMGSPNREITDAEREIFQNIVDEMYEQFVATVSDGRGMNPAQVREVADGRILTGQQALECGLVDNLGNYYDALSIAADLAGIEGTPEVVELAPHRSWWETLSSIKLDIPSFYTASWLIYAPALENRGR